MDGTDEGRGKNQLAIRAANKRIREIADVFASFDDSPSDYTCECVAADCFDPIPLFPSEYDEVRERLETFLVLPYHMTSDERVVKRTSLYWVVEKT